MEQSYDNFGYPPLTCNRCVKSSNIDDCQIKSLIVNPYYKEGNHKKLMLIGQINQPIRIKRTPKFDYQTLNMELDNIEALIKQETAQNLAMHPYFNKPILKVN